MKKAPPANLAASIRQKLLNCSREHREEFMLTLTHFAIERLLYYSSRIPEGRRELKSRTVVRGTSVNWLAQVALICEI